MVMKLLCRLLVGIICGISASACATAQARSAAAVPLVIPEPPPRAAIEPSSSPPERPSPPAVATPRPASPPASAQPPAPSPAPASAPAAVGPQPTAPAPPTSSVLRSGGAGVQSISAREVREIIDRTSTKLGALHRARLSAGKRADFDAARRFLSQAQEAAKDNNLMLAYYSAEKAETLADGLR